MKSNKNYVFVSLAAQMIIVPIILTIGLFVVASIMSYFPSLEWNTGSTRFIQTLTAFLASLLAGVSVGFIFSRFSKSGTDSAKAKYLTPLLPIIYALVFAIVALTASKGDYNSGWWFAYLIKNPAFFIFDFALFFSGLHFLAPVAELMGYTGFVFGIYLNEYISRAAIKSEASRNLKLGFVMISIAAVTFSGITTKDVINNGIIEVLYGKSTVGKELTEYDLLAIAPFTENNGLAQLDKPSSLQFTEFDTMPRLDGATAAYPVYAAFVEAVYKGLGEYYEANQNNHEKDVYTAFVASDDHPYNIVKCSKTGTAYERLMNGQTDIIFVAEPSNSHLEAIKAKGDEFVLTPIGSEAFVFFTNVQNPVENLTVKQIQDIYSGKITNWKKVGRHNKKILPYQRPENSGSQTIMQNRVMKDIKMSEPTKETFAGGMGEIISEVAGYKNAKNAIGYSFMYYSSEMIKNNQIKYISIDGIKPAPETIRSKTYPFTVPVYAVTLKSNTNENVSKFLDWVVSEEGQSLVEKTGYVSNNAVNTSLK